MNRNGWSDAQLMATMADAVSCISETNAMKTRENMINAGFEQLGNGNFAAAFTRPDIEGYVIKITKGNDNFPAYVYWALANPSPAVPEYRFPFLSTVAIPNRWTDTGDRQFAVMMPAYQSDSFAVQGSPDYQAAEGILHGWESGRDFDGPMAEAAIAMKQFFGHSVNWDLHGANVMIDPLDGSFKITDPFCGELDYNQLSQLTGRNYVEGHAMVQENLFGPDLCAQRDREWPRPAYADRVAQMARPKGHGMGGLPAVPRGAVAARLAMNPIKWRMPTGVQMFNFADIGERFAAAFEDGVVHRNMGLKPIMVGDRAANKQELAQLGRFLQGEDLMKKFRAGVKDIGVCLAPSVPAFLKLGKTFNPDEVVPIKRIRLSLAQAEYIQGQFKVAKLNRDQQNFGKGWQPPILNL